MAATRSTPASPVSAATGGRKKAARSPRKGKAKRKPKPPPSLPSRDGEPDREAAAAAPRPREATAARVHSMVERELDAVERVLAALAPDDPGNAERAARALASIARTLRDLSQMNAAGGDVTDEGPEATTADDDDPPPRDLDEFRRELARRIDAFLGEGTDGGFPDGDEAGLERAPRA
jgi:hypothetical protein